MRSLPVLDGAPAPRRLPPWLRRPLPSGNGNFYTQGLLRELRLETVCENARCPNRPECYARRTATFMILGNVCTRPCGFCAVPRGQPDVLEGDEPERLAEAASRLGLKHVVITSVTRDDLPDGGADHFYQCILAARARTGAVIEVLTPDFLGNTRAIDRVLEARPEVYNHNMETVPRLYKKVRGRADYQRSLDLLAHVKRHAPALMTKSGLMLGLGETTEELLEVLADLRTAGCDTLTLGQYLAPTLKHVPVVRYVPPEEFTALGALARSLGFAQVASGPFVRSSYHAEDMVEAMRAEIVLPELGAAPVVLSLWFADPGDPVFEGDRLVEVLMSGATFDVAAPATGRLAEKWAHPDDPLRPGQVLGLVDVGDSTDPSEEGS